MSLGDKAFAEFLTDEIKEEKKIQKSKSLPKMSGGWELQLNGTEAKLVRSISGEKWETFRFILHNQSVFIQTDVINNAVFILA